MEVEFSEDSAQHLFSDFLAFLSRVGTVREDFRLDRWDETVLLADKSVFGRPVALAVMASSVGHPVAWEISKTALHLANLHPSL